MSLSDTFLHHIRAFFTPPAEEISFDWEYEELPGSGTVFRPYVPVFLKLSDAGWKPFHFIADSGADTSMAPCYIADLCGIDLKRLKKNEAFGIGGSGIRTWETTIPIRIGSWHMTIPISITEDHDTPLLLGRADTLDSEFSWIFDHHKKKIIFRR